MDAMVEKIKEFLDKNPNSKARAICKEIRGDETSFWAIHQGALDTLLVEHQGIEPQNTPRKPNKRKRTDANFCLCGFK